MTRQSAAIDGSARGEDRPPSELEHAPRLRDAGQTATARLLLAKGLFEKGRQEQALLEVEGALRENPELAQAHLMKGFILARRSDHRAAAECLERAAQFDEGLVGAWLGLAYSRIELGLLDEALSAADRGIAKDGTQANGHFLRGEILSAMKRPGDAIAAYRLAIQCNPQLVMARYKLGHLLAETGSTTEAIQQTIAALRLSPIDVNARLALGDLLRRLGRHEEAVKEYQTALEFSPRHALAYAKLGETFLELGCAAEALTTLKIAIGLDPKQVSSYLYIGRIYMEQIRIDEAIGMFQAALKIDPDFVEAEQLLSDALIHELCLN